MGAVSSGHSNDELVDNLMKSGFIRTKKVEHVFRAVDRADYFLLSRRDNAYKDIAWKRGNIHLSAPCIYSEVMEGLSLEPGLSFLNLGSGTGYLSTMAGLILSQHGTNHGIELHEDCVKYAYERLEEFKQKSLALDEFDFCEPLFIQGNCLNVAPSRQYDRVYCGAACPEHFARSIEQFVRIGGILVMPYKDHLVRAHRIDEDTWMHFTMFPVSFTPLVVPTASEQSIFHLPECDPLSLRELCRGRIRNRLRENVWNEHADLETKKTIQPRRRKNEFSPPLQVRFGPPHQNSRRFVTIFEESDEVLFDEDEEFTRRVDLLLHAALFDVQPYRVQPFINSYVRAMVQSNQNDDPNWQEEDNDDNDDNDNRCNEDSESSGNRNAFLNEESLLYTARTNDAERDSNLMEAESENRIDMPANDINKTYLNGSDSDTEPEEPLVQRRRMTKREKTDSETVEDVTSSNEDASSSSNTNQSDPEIVDPMDMDLADIVLSTTDISHPISGDNSSTEKVIIAHYVDSDAFSTYMKEKIHQLPLPFPLKLYINYNREL